jgi:2-polyprenyl-3-methyl-5-hydroxy-6-metoxy-1,4-benzoquinol methylase
MNAIALGFRPLQFDLIIASHLIEHLDEKERGAFLADLVRVLHPQGATVIATPNHPSGIYFQQDGFHKILYDAESLGQILGEHFKSIAVYGVHEQILLPIVRPLLRAGKRILLRTGLLSRTGIQEAIARTSTSSTSLNFKVTGETRKACNLIAVCRSPTNQKQDNG